MDSINDEQRAEMSKDNSRERLLDLVRDESERTRGKGDEALAGKGVRRNRTATDTERPIAAAEPTMSTIFFRVVGTNLAFSVLDSPGVPDVGEAVSINGATYSVEGRTWAYVTDPLNLISAATVSLKPAER